jgi:UDP-N-acetylmuramoyl-L-alanyl-D-glutamate--2,6-diaminopimelate ligase
VKLGKILQDVEFSKIYGDADIDISDISIDSRKIARGGLFAAVKGFSQDGHDYAPDAVRNGAAAIIANKKLVLDPGVTQVIVGETRPVLPVISRNFFNYPSKSLKIIGITGTNGKTTTCYLIDSILRTAGIKTSMITTYKSFIDGTEVKFDRTTPESPDLQRFFSKSLDQGVQFALMEVSSHSVDLHRVDFIDFDYLVFTNLSQDHLDYHGNIENYFEVKSRLFDASNNRFFGNGKAIINIDDSFGRRLFEKSSRTKTSYAIDNIDASVKAENILNSIAGIKMDVLADVIPLSRIETPLCGIFNVYNILAAFSVCMEAGIDPGHIISGIKKMKGFGGRFEKIGNDPEKTVIVDYAHTPDGLQNVLETARDILAGKGKLISVFGCGGDRDKDKRKKMGAISANLADISIITSDNPRSEEPDSIIDMIEEGFKNEDAKQYIRITDREKAIFEAMDMAGPGDLVLIAGKGHEDYQEFENGRRIPFSDPLVVRKYYENKSKN